MRQRKSSESDQREALLNVKAFRAQRTRVSLLPYEVLMAEDHWTDARVNLAEDLLTSGWRLRDGTRVCLRPPIPWDDIGGTNRSWSFHLHSWDPFGILLSGYDRTRREIYLRVTCDAALEWVRHYSSVDTSSQFAWYDMAVGVRAYRLAYLLDAVSRDGAYDDDTVAYLLAAACAHAAALSDDAIFAPHSNHGFYVAAGQAALSRRFPDVDAIAEGSRQAQRRLEEMLGQQYTEEGVHREHSPDYHRMVSLGIEGLVRQGLIHTTALDGLRGKFRRAMAWFIMPNYHLLMFGDSPHHRVDPGGWESCDDELDFVLSAGQQGRCPGTYLQAFPASGYAVIRQAWPSPGTAASECSYLAQTCAFHSRTHKHADDLSFVWYDHGQELLIDAGRYGYLGRTETGSDLWNDGFWYSDPNRIYVESTRAHNTVEIDRRNFARRGIKPYSSALRRYGEWAGIYYTESEVRHWKTIRHARVLLFRPAEWLIVYDWLWDNAELSHDFRQRFLFAPELELVVNGEVADLPLLGTAQHLYMAPLLKSATIEPVRGQREPELLGWVSRQDGEMTPCWTGGFAAEGTPCHTFATLFTFGEQAPEPVAESSNAARNGRNAILSWRQGGVRNVVSFSRPARGAFQIDYRLAVGNDQRNMP